MRAALRARRWFPPPGLAYRLFDTGMLLLIVSLCWYVLSPPSEVTVTALSDTFDVFFRPQTWGLALAITGGLATVLSYMGHRAIFWGYVILASACVGWCAALFTGILLADASYDVTLKAVGSAVFFGWMTRGLLVAVLTRAEEDPK